MSGQAGLKPCVYLGWGGGGYYKKGGGCHKRRGGRPRHPQGPNCITKLGGHLVATVRDFIVDSCYSICPLIDEVEVRSRKEELSIAVEIPPSLIHNAKAPRGMVRLFSQPNFHPLHSIKHPPPLPMLGSKSE